MIDPKIKSGRRFGVQGSLNFDTTSLSANPVLYKEMTKLMQGVYGFGGAGGVRAHRLNSGTEFSESQVYKTKRERDAVQRRLEAQLTEQLTIAFGDTAQKAGMSIPEFLQSQGVGGIREVGEGDARRMTAFGVDNFQEVTFNPLLSSNEKAIRSMVKSSGGFSDHFGGTNEHRRVKALVRAPLAREIGERSRKVALDLETGLGNKGDLEGAYLSRAEKMMVNNKRKTVNNAVIAGEAFSEEPALVEKLRSDRIKADQIERLKARVDQDLEAEGLISPKAKKDSGRKESPAKKAAVGLVALVGSMYSAVKKIQTLTGMAVSYLKTMASMTGNLMANAAMTGLNWTELTQANRWGRVNSVYNQGNENIMTDAFAATSTGAANILRSGKRDFEEPAFTNRAWMIDTIIGGSLGGKPDPKKILTGLYGGLAHEYFSAKEKDRPALLLEQSLALGSALPGTENLYAAFIQKNDVKNSKYNLDPKAALNIVADAFSSVSNKPGVDKAGYMMAQVTGGFVNTSIGDKGNVASLNDILGVLKRIEDSVLQFILSNMGSIVGLLTTIAEGILILASFKSESANHALESLRSASAEQAKAGLRDTLENRARVRSSLENTLVQRGFPPDRAKRIANNIKSLDQMESYGLTKGPKNWLWKQTAIEVGLIESLTERVDAYEKQGKRKRLIGGWGLPLTGQYKLNNFLIRNKLTLGSSDNINKILGYGAAGAAGEMSAIEARMDQRDDQIEKGNEARDTDAGRSRYERESGGSGGSLDDAKKWEAEQQRKRDLESLQRNNRMINFNPLMSEIGALAMAGRHEIISKGSSMQSSEPVTIIHNVNLKVNNKEIFSASNNFDADVANRFFIQDSKANA
jgi:hypothetical protein